MRASTDNPSTTTRSTTQNLLTQWTQALTAAIDAQKAVCDQQKRYEKRFRIELRQLPSSELAKITRREVLHWCKRDTEPTVIKVVTSLYKGIAHKFRESVTFDRHSGIPLSARLVQLLIETATVTTEKGETCPALAHNSEIRGSVVRQKKYGRLWLTYEAERVFGTSRLLKRKYVPALAPPAWTTKVLKWSPQRNSADQSKAPLVPSAIHALGRVPWRVNGDMLRVVSSLWTQQDKDGIGDMPKWLTEAEMQAARKEWWKYKDRRYPVSEQIAFERMLSVARDYEGATSIYFPHEIDFRGRAYARPRYLNHQGNDVCRALLEFAEPRPLTDRGRFWLSVQLANCCGQNKRRFEDCVAWVENNREMLRHWAANPVQSAAEWREMDEPFQAVAAAMALFNDEHGERLPVQVDGSNNALQHYAAMLRSEKLARCTNMSPRVQPGLFGRRPDFYQNVANAVRALLITHNSRGYPKAAMLRLHPELVNRLPVPLVGADLNRKIIKTAAMTLFYSATPEGTFRQIARAFKDAGYFWTEESEWQLACNFVQEKTRQMASYWAPEAFTAMKWLHDCAERIAREGEEVQWTTPLGMVVQQRYRTWPKAKEINTRLQKISLRPEWTEDWPVNPGKQARAFAPNFVHSLDAAHMMLTALACADKSVAFAAVHDSFLESRLRHRHLAAHSCGEVRCSA